MFFLQAVRPYFLVNQLKKPNKSKEELLGFGYNLANA